MLLVKWRKALRELEIPKANLAHATKFLLFVPVVNARVQVAITSYLNFFEN